MTKNRKYIYPDDECVDIDESLYEADEKNAASVECPVCFGKQSSENSEAFGLSDVLISSDMLVLSCDHMICEKCYKGLKVNQEGKRQCPLCRDWVEKENYYKPPSFWEKEFKANGVVDVHKLLAFEKLTDEKIIDYFISDCAKSGRYKRMFCNSKYKSQEEKAQVGLIQYETKEGKLEPLQMKDKDDKWVKVGISDEVLRRQLNRKFLGCSKIDWSMVNLARLYQLDLNNDKFRALCHELLIKDDRDTLSEIFKSSSSTNARKDGN